MTLAIATTYNDLPVCSTCGWPMAGQSEVALHANDCSYANAGKSATALARRFPELTSTKFGYGTEHLTFNLEDDLNVRFQCSCDETFQLHWVWLSDDLTADEAAELVKAIADWRSDCIRTRNRSSRTSAGQQEGGSDDEEDER